MNCHSKTCIAFGLMLVAIAGCGGDGFKGERGTVNGKITLDGKPVPEGCRVLFTSPVGSYIASGVVKAEGKYEMSYLGKPLMPAVKYQVTITPPVEAAKPADKKVVVDPIAAGKSLTSESSQNNSKKITETGPIPSKYWSAGTSKLVCTVLGGPNKDVDFELQK